MTKPANLEAIEAATSIAWSEWLVFLDGANARSVPHKAIAQMVYDKLDKNQASRGWWAQGVAVAYEQHIGRRAPGQRSDGSYEVAVSKTYAGTMDEAMQAWVDMAAGTTEFHGVALAAAATSSATQKWRHWRASLADGSKISVDTHQKTASKAGLTITHTKLTSAKAAEQWRTFWKQLLKAL